MSIPVDALTMFLNISGIQVLVGMSCFVLLIIPLIVSVLYLHSALRIARADKVLAVKAWKGTLAESRILSDELTSLNNRYNTMEATFLHNERQLKELTYKLRVELDVVKTERDQFGIKLTESESKLYKLQEELDSVLLHYNP